VGLIIQGRTSSPVFLRSKDSARIYSDSKNKAERSAKFSQRKFNRSPKASPIRGSKLVRFLAEFQLLYKVAQTTAAESDEFPEPLETHWIIEMADAGAVHQMFEQMLGAKALPESVESLPEISLISPKIRQLDAAPF